MRRVYILLGLSACAVRLTVPRDTAIACESSAECPANDKCVVSRCISEENARLPPPRLGDVTVQPAVLGKGMTLAISFASDQNLLQTSVRLGERTLDALSYQVSGDEPELTTPVTADVVGANGEPTSIALGEVRFDFTPPKLESFALDAPFDSLIVVKRSAKPSYHALVETGAVLGSAGLVDDADNVIADVSSFVHLQASGSGQSVRATLPLLAFIAIGTEQRVGLRLTLSDDVGNSASATSPLLTVDARAPQTVITQAPAPSTTQTHASFSFAAEANASYSCSLDGALAAPCTSPTSYELGVGEHAFSVQATDAAGNVEQTPVTHVWTIQRAWASVAIGARIACATTTDGRLYCWGDNSDGQLGNGQTDPAKTPQREATFSSNWRAVSVATHHACGLRETGAIACWGENIDGMLGSEGLGLAPLAVGAPTGWQDVAAIDPYGGCGVHEETPGVRALYCWGTLAGAASTPMRIGTDTDWLDVKGSGDRDNYWAYACARKNDHRLFCFGYGYTNTPTARASTWRSFSAAPNLICGVRDAGTLHCWGSAADSVALGAPLPLDGQLGTDSDWSEVSVGAGHLCATKSSQLTYCWGDNAAGQLGTGHSTPPVHTLGAAISDHVVAGGLGSCTLNALGTLACAGYNGFLGQLGTGVTPLTGSLVPRDLGVGHVQVAMGYGSGAAIDQSGTLRAWGSESNWMPPAEPSAEQDWIALASAETTVCAIRDDGGAHTLFCYGMGDYNELGSEYLALGPIPIGSTNSTHDKWASISGGYGFYCGIRDDAGARKLHCFGKNDYGQASDLNTDNVVEPTQLGAFADWRSVDCGDEHCCGIRPATGPSGLLYCWGNGDHGACGDGDSTVHSVAPTGPLTAFTDWQNVSAGAYATCGVRADGSLWCFGANNAGQLGTGSTATSVTSPTQVASGITSVTMPNYGSAICALANDGSLVCAGSNGTGQLGDGTRTTHLGFAPASTPPTVWTQISMGGGTLCGVGSDGNTYCTGSGDGAFDDHAFYFPSFTEVAVPL